MAVFKKCYYQFSRLILLELHRLLGLGIVHNRHYLECHHLIYDLECLPRYYLRLDFLNCHPSFIHFISVLLLVE